jgi:hypothetical protein
VGQAILPASRLGFLELDADVFHLTGEPLAGLLGGFPVGFEVLLDERLRPPARERVLREAVPL